MNILKQAFVETITEVLEHMIEGVVVILVYKLFHS